VAMDLLGELVDGTRAVDDDVPSPVPRREVAVRLGGARPEGDAVALDPVERLSRTSTWCPSSSSRCDR